MVCKCINEIDKLHLADAYAERIAADFLHTIGPECCAEMASYIIEQIIARLVHIDCSLADISIDENDNRTLDAVSRRSFDISRVVPGTVMKIINASRAGVRDASH